MKKFLWFFLIAILAIGLIGARKWYLGNNLEQDDRMFTNSIKDDSVITTISDPNILAVIDAKKDGKTPLNPIKENDVVCSIPIEGNVMGYDRPDDAPTLDGRQGPTAFTVAPNGTFWFIDPVGGAVRQYDQRCKPLSVIPMPYFIDDALYSSSYNPKGIVATDNRIFLLAGNVYGFDIVISFDYAGNFLGKFFLNGAEMMQQYYGGIIIDEQGEVVVQGDYIFEGRGKDYRLTENKGINFVSKAIEYIGVYRYDILAAEEQRQNGYYQDLIVGDKNINIYAKYGISFGNIPYVSSNGNVDWSGIILAESTGISMIGVVFEINDQNELVGISRIPWEKQMAGLTSFNNFIAAQSDGQLYYLLTQQDRLDILKLHFNDHLDTPAKIIHESDDLSAEQILISMASDPVCKYITQDNIWTYVQAYMNNTTYLTANNINGACNTRTKPRYMSTAGTYSIMPYDWGGIISVYNFNTAMKNTSPIYVAGDINYNKCCDVSCSKGVDCTGFVQMAWGLEGYGTNGKLGANLTQYSTKLATPTDINQYRAMLKTLVFGDALYSASGTKPPSGAPPAKHIVLFARYDAPNDEVWTYEATTANSMDGVSYFKRSVKNDLWWSYYVPYRYKGLTLGAPKSFAFPSGIVKPQKI